MLTTDQNMAFASLESNLIPGTSLIDGRTPQDQYAFLIHLASTLNFYNDKNTVEGNWTPFLLKDPLFLLSHISKTKYDYLFGIFENNCHSLESILKKDTNASFEKTGAPIAQLMNLFLGIFKQLHKWSHFMLATNVNYRLKKYTLDGIKKHYGKYLWAILSLQEKLINEGAIQRLGPIIYNEFESYDEKIWKQSKNLGPYWEILGLSDPHKKKSTPNEIHKSLSNLGNVLFSFLHMIISYSNVEFENLEKTRNNFPDTTLLRTFINLLKVHQDDLNSISKKHLDFYYETILKQTRKLASPDNVFINAKLSKNDAAFQLPKGTLFDAGVDSQNKPVTFESISSSSLNPAIINSAYTLTQLQQKQGCKILDLQQIKNPSIIKKSQDGKVMGWPTFGDTSMIPEKPTSMGLAFGSPMLFLREGKREVTITLTFKEGNMDTESFENAQYFLSTEKAWLEITPQENSLTISHPTINHQEQKNQIAFTFTLGPMVKSIEAFKKNPDGYTCSWPLFKIIFNSFLDPNNPPTITTIEIDVKVCKLKNFKLYNDAGAINIQKPFQLFGPKANIGSSFIMGNAEIFSKPYTSLIIGLDWGQLPLNKDFSSYYEQYNDYLVGKYDTIAASTKKSWWQSLINFFTGHSKKPLKEPDINLFNNTAFTVSFDQLGENGWSDFLMKKQNCSIDPQGCMTNCIDYVQDSGCANQSSNNSSNLLFGTDGKNCQLTPNSFFKYVSKTVPDASMIDPYIQNTDLKFSEKSQTGFIKMNLSAPEYGFGNDLYPQVISTISLYNAASIVNKTKSGSINLVKTPNLPFIPQVSQFTASYDASFTYDFDKNQYPIQCYLYSPFRNYLCYDNTAETTGYTSYSDAPSNNQSEEKTTGIPLFPKIQGSKTLFIELKNLVVPNEVHLYFQMASNPISSKDPKNARLSYSFLGEKGWKNLVVLSNGTNNFSCSGIICFDFGPLDDITSESNLMPQGSYWLSITADDTNFSETLLLTTNGIPLVRSGDDFLNNTSVTHIKPETISKPKIAIPEIASVQQPFPSFGGKAAESKEGMYKRVSTRLKTKDRLITQEDFYHAIKLNFPEIYYSKIVHDKLMDHIEIYPIKQYQQWTDAGAFVPLVTPCEKVKIEQFLTKKVSPFANLQIKSFIPEYIEVNSTIIIDVEADAKNAEKTINEALNIFLSPWIESTQKQIDIENNINVAQVGDFLKSLKDVVSIQSLSFNTYLSTQERKKEIITKNASQISIQAPSNLFVSIMEHSIICKPIT